MSNSLDFIYRQSANQQEILHLLHELIMSFPEVEDKIRFKVPFYFKNSWICYLNPVKGDGIELAFTRANELSNEQGLLDFGDRKQIAGIKLYNKEAIPTETILEILQEAILLDETVSYSVRKKKK